MPGTDFDGDKVWLQRFKIFKCFSLKTESFPGTVPGIPSGGTRILFRNLPKFSNIQKTFGPSCLSFKIMPSDEIWVHGHIQEPRNGFEHLRTLDWDKHPLKSLFSQNFFIIVIRVHRSTSWPSPMKKEVKIRVDFATWSSAILKTRNHKLSKKVSVYILIL